MSETSETLLHAHVSDITSQDEGKVREIAKAFGDWCDCYAVAYGFPNGEWGILIAAEPHKMTTLPSQLDAFWAGWECRP